MTKRTKRIPGTASLVFFYFGEEEKYKALAQETVPLARAFRGCERSILLSHDVDFTVGGRQVFELSQKAEELADVWLTPTKDNFAASLSNLANSGLVTDLFIFSHGSTNSFLCSGGTYGDDKSIRGSWLEKYVPTNLKLRMVYQINCFGSSLNGLWRDLGAKAAAGSRFVNFYPTRFNEFIKHWNDGLRFGQSLHRSDDAGARTGPQAYMILEALRTQKQWGGCPFGRTVLGGSECAKRYFCDPKVGWFVEDEWRDSKTGKENMNYASRMLVAGDRKITRELVW
jgi:hypothetical protein